MYYHGTLEPHVLERLDNGVHKGRCINAYDLIGRAGRVCERTQGIEDGADPSCFRAGMAYFMPGDRPGQTESRNPFRYGLYGIIRAKVNRHA